MGDGMPPLRMSHPWRPGGDRRDPGGGQRGLCLKTPSELSRRGRAGQGPEQEKGEGKAHQLVARDG